MRTRKRIWMAGIISLILLATATVAAGRSLAQNKSEIYHVMEPGLLLILDCSGNRISVEQHSVTHVEIGCHLDQPSPTPVPPTETPPQSPLPTPTPTDTPAPPVPIPTDTPAPPTPTPTDTPAPGPSEPYAGAPACPDHDPYVWHSLWDAERGCHYDHEHGDDPALADYLFGPLGSAWGQPGTMVYPWQTFRHPDINSNPYPPAPPPDSPDWENRMKHAGYKVYVRDWTNRGCNSQFTGGCVLAVRTVVHGIGASIGAITRRHSVWAEMIVCPNGLTNVDLSNPDVRNQLCGTIMAGGWQDKGSLSMPFEIGGQTVPVFYPEFGTERPNPGNRLLYAGGWTGNSQIPPAPENAVGDWRFQTWYGDLGFRNGDPNLIGSIGIVQQMEDSWGPTPLWLGDAFDPTAPYLACPEDPANCGYNNSRRQLHIAGSGMTARMVRDIATRMGVPLTNPFPILNYRGWTDRAGQLVDGCTGPGLDCIPFSVYNYDPNLQYQTRFQTVLEYDITPAGEQSWIRYPN